MRLKNLLAALVISQVVAISQSSANESFAEVLSEQLEANDYLCGSLTVQVPYDWKIVNVRVNQGSIQNQFQFSQDDSDSSLYLPKENKQGGNLLQIRQSTGISGYSRTYVTSYPIDIDLTLAQDGLFNEVTYRITKNVCNAIQVGDVEVTHTSGNPVNYKLINSEQDDTTGLVHKLSSRFYTPAYLVLPYSSTP